MVCKSQASTPLVSGVQNQQGLGLSALSGWWELCQVCQSQHREGSELLGQWGAHPTCTPVLGVPPALSPSMVGSDRRCELSDAPACTGMDLHKELHRIEAKEGLRGRKLQKALESFAWNITVLKVRGCADPSPPQPLGILREHRG